MLIEAFDTVIFAEIFLERLHEASKRLAKKQLVEEKQWVQTAIERLTAVVTPVAGVTTKCAQLPELEEVRPVLAKTVQNAAIDAVERLQAGITFHLGPRAPVIEELFAAKLPPLRRANREDFENFITSFNRKLKMQYIKRTLASDDCAPVQGALTAVTQGFDAWRAAFSPEPLSENEAETLRAQLTVAADSISPVLHQARLLVEAATFPVEGLFVELGLAAKPKKRSAPKAAPVVEASSAPETELPPPEAIEAQPQAVAKKGKRSAQA